MDPFEAVYGSDSNLLAAKDKLTERIVIAADTKDPQIPIILVIAIIGLIIQLISFCRNRDTTDDSIRGYIQNSTRLSPLKTWRLRREIWREAVSSGAFSVFRANEAFKATLETGETLTADEITALLVASKK